MYRKTTYIEIMNLTTHGSRSHAGNTKVVSLKFLISYKKEKESIFTRKILPTRLTSLGLKVLIHLQ